jgi:hypothetical protein
MTDDLEKQLARLGYRGVERDAVCWQVAPIGHSKPKHQPPGEVCSQQITRNSDLYLWIIMTGETTAEPYKITRIPG